MFLDVRQSDASYARSKSMWARTARRFPGEEATTSSAVPRAPPSSKPPRRRTYRTREAGVGDIVSAPCDRPSRGRVTLPPSVEPATAKVVSARRPRHGGVAPSRLRETAMAAPWIGRRIGGPPVGALASGRPSCPTTSLAPAGRDDRSRAGNRLAEEPDRLWAANPGARSEAARYREERQ